MIHNHCLHRKGRGVWWVVKEFRGGWERETVATVTNIIRNWTIDAIVVANVNFVCFGA
jgi:predicted type IV restriction endonuclease